MKMRTGLKRIWQGLVFLAAAVLFSVPALASEKSGEGNTLTVVEYEDLRELLKAGNESLKEIIEDQETSMAPYEEMVRTLKKEQKYMEEMAEGFEDEGDTEMQELYESNADQLKDAASQVNARLRSMKSGSVARSYEKQVDLALAAAQSLMNSCKQMELQVEAQEKQTEAVRASFEEIRLRCEAGLSKSSEADEASERLAAAENSLASLKESFRELKGSLFTMLGLPKDSEISLGEIPEADSEAIAAINFESDKEEAVRNDSTYASEMNSRVGGGSDGKLYKRQRIEDAVSEETSSITAAYERLLNQQTKYQAALEAYQAAELTYQALLRKKDAGLLSNADYLAGEASYAAALAEKKTAAMELYQSYETYCWEVKGRV